MCNYIVMYLKKLNFVFQIQSEDEDLMIVTKRSPQVNLSGGGGGIFCVNPFSPVLQASEEGESGENESVESGLGQYRTYTPPPLLDEVAEATESAPEGMQFQVTLTNQDVLKHTVERDELDELEQLWFLKGTTNLHDTHLLCPRCPCAHSVTIP